MDGLIVPRCFFICAQNSFAMRTRITVLWEEINYYRRCNKELEAEDLLRKIIGEKPMNEKKIKWNEERIERLFEAMMEC